MAGRFAQLLGLAALLSAATLGAAVSHQATDGRGLKLYLDSPGVYAVPLAALRGVGQNTPAEVDPGAWRLSHRGQPVPWWLDHPGDADRGRRLIFVAGTDLFRPAEPHEPRSQQVVVLTADTPIKDPQRLSDPPSDPALSGTTTLVPFERAIPRRRVLWEEDRLRAAVTRRGAEEIDSLWYWAMLSQQSSSTHVVELGALSGRAPDEPSQIRLTVRMLGWSQSPTPTGLYQHQVDLSLNGTAVGTGRWNGRRTQEIRIDRVSPALLDASTNRLQIKIPQRFPDGEEDPIVDIAYLDRVELLYAAAAPFSDATTPLLLSPSPDPRWLPDPISPAGSRAYATTGWVAARVGKAGWVLPPAVSDTEIWIVDESGLRLPAWIEPTTSDFPDLLSDAEGVLIAPHGLIAGAERLAGLHRRRGHSVEVVNVDAVYDTFDGGVRGPRAIRRFLDNLYELSGALRYVLIIGDADWLGASDQTSAQRRGPGRQHRVPTWTYLSDYGPAASDHYYAMDPANEARPRFAVGRLPVSNAIELARILHKLEARAEAPRPGRDVWALMLSDRSRGSLLRRERLLNRLRDAAIELRLGIDSPATTPVDAARAAWGRHPWLVYFGGHGGRYLWQLGDPKQPDPASFFDLEDVRGLPRGGHLPIVISVSCATAPFDHPNADSLGEVMLLEENKGAIAYIGASAMLFTPRSFGESLVRALLRAETLGDALIEAKLQTDTARVSHLYSLLGDPTLPLRHP